LLKITEQRYKYFLNEAKFSFLNCVHTGLIVCGKLHILASCFWAIGEGYYSDFSLLL
jgi:hypothetical protein